MSTTFTPLLWTLRKLGHVKYCFQHILTLSISFPQMEHKLVPVLHEFLHYLARLCGCLLGDLLYPWRFRAQPSKGLHALYFGGR